MTAFLIAHKHLHRKIPMMYYDYCQGKSFQQCLQSLSNFSGDHSPSWSTDHKWYKEFQFGRTTFEDSDRCGKFVTNLWGAADAEIKVPSAENTELKGSRKKVEKKGKKKKRRKRSREDIEKLRCTGSPADTAGEFLDVCGTSQRNLLPWLFVVGHSRTWGKSCRSDCMTESDGGSEP